MVYKPFDFWLQFTKQYHNLRKQKLVEIGMHLRKIKYCSEKKTGNGRHHCKEAQQKRNGNHYERSS